MRLKLLPMDTVKVDRSFIENIAKDPKDRALVMAIVAMARNLGVKVVAEGVENQQDWDLVASMGCDQVQGYFVSRPLPFAQLLKWLNDFDVQKKFVPGA